MMTAPDAASVATMLWLEKLIGSTTGPSTGTNLWRARQRAQDMVKAGRAVSIVTILCDNAQRSLDTNHNPQWINACIGACDEFPASSMRILPDWPERGHFPQYLIQRGYDHRRILGVDGQGRADFQHIVFRPLAADQDAMIAHAVLDIGAYLRGL